MRCTIAFAVLLTFRLIQPAGALKVPMNLDGSEQRVATWQSARSFIETAASRPFWAPPVADPC